MIPILCETVLPSPPQYPHNIARMRYGNAGLAYGSALLLQLKRDQPIKRTH